MRKWLLPVICITAKLLTSSDPKQTYGPSPYCFVYCCRGPFPPFLPHDFLFAIVVPPPLRGHSFSSTFYRASLFPVIDALNGVRRPDWMVLLCLSDVASILHSDRSPVVCRWTLSWTFTFVTVTSPTCSFMRLSLVLCTENLCNIFMSVAHRHTCLLNFTTVMNFGHLVAATPFSFSTVTRILEEWKKHASYDLL